MQLASASHSKIAAKVWESIGNTKHPNRTHSKPPTSVVHLQSLQLYLIFMAFPSDTILHEHLEQVLLSLCTLKHVVELCTPH